jgi:anti-anti-sigma factor
VSVSFDGSVFVIELFGELDLRKVPELESVISEAEKSSAQTVLIDLSSLEFIDSSGLQVLVSAAERSRAGGTRVCFLRGGGQVGRVLELCGLGEFLHYLD